MEICFWICDSSVMTAVCTGYAGVVRFGGLRIGGLSGIFKERDYAHGHFEHPPYNENTKRSCYHIRNVDVFRLKQVKCLGQRAPFFNDITVLMDDEKEGDPASDTCWLASGMAFDHKNFASKYPRNTLEVTTKWAV